MEYRNISFSEFWISCSNILQTRVKFKWVNSFWIKFKLLSNLSKFRFSCCSDAEIAGFGTKSESRTFSFHTNIFFLFFLPLTSIMTIIYLQNMIYTTCSLSVICAYPQKNAFCLGSNLLWILSLLWTNRVQHILARQLKSYMCEYLWKIRRVVKLRTFEGILLMRLVAIRIASLYKNFELPRVWFFSLLDVFVFSFSYPFYVRGISTRTLLNDKMMPFFKK